MVIQQLQIRISPSLLFSKVLLLQKRTTAEAARLAELRDAKGVLPERERPIKMRSLDSHQLPSDSKDRKGSPNQGFGYGSKTLQHHRFWEVFLLLPIGFFRYPVFLTHSQINLDKTGCMFCAHRFLWEANITEQDHLCPPKLNLPLNEFLKPGAPGLGIGIQWL